MDGGGHERGMRSGTLNVSGIVGFGAACEICGAEMEAERDRLLALRKKFETELSSRLDVVEVNGHAEELRKGCLSQRIDYVRVDTANPLDVVLTSYLSARAARSKRNK